MKDWRIVAVLLLCLVLAGSMACSPFGGGNNEEASRQLVAVVRGDLIVSVSGSGNIDVSSEVRLAFGSNGRVDKIYVKESDEVTKGEVLAKLDTDTLELALTQAQLALKEAEHNLEEANEPYTEQEIRSAKVAVDKAKRDLDYAKRQQLEASFGWPSYTDHMWYRNSVYDAQEILTAAQETLDEMLAPPDEDEIVIMEIGVETAKQSLEQAQKQLDEATIIAPFVGVVASVDADEGDSVSTTKTIVHLIDLTTMELRAEVDEIDIPSVRKGQKAIIDVDALPDLQIEGEIISISQVPVVQAGLITYDVTIALDLLESSEVKVGMSATVDIIIDKRSNVLPVPNRAIKQDNQGNPIVEVMVNEQIQERSVVVGISDGYQTEIVSGLHEGDVVVIEKRV